MSIIEHPDAKAPLKRNEFRQSLPAKSDQKPIALSEIQVNTNATSPETDTLKDELTLLKELQVTQ